MKQHIGKIGKEEGEKAKRITALFACVLFVLGAAFTPVMAGLNGAYSHCPSCNYDRMYYDMREGMWDQYDDDNHIVTMVEIHLCHNCGYSETVPYTAFLQAHSYGYNNVCICGHPKS